jgi:acyl transferase domain-containing protein
LFAAGVPVDWSALFAGTSAQRTELPTYVFQHQHYWLENSAFRNTDLGLIGLNPVDHPLLRAEVPLGDDGGRVLTGTLSVAQQPWLADHVVLGVTILPGTGVVALALQSALRTGAGQLEELVLHAPLVVPDHGGAQLQLIVDPPDPAGRRGLRVLSRPGDATEDNAWVRHAEGTLAPPLEALPFAAEADWYAGPSPDSQTLDITTAYDGLARRGYDYGPAFRALRTIRCSGDEVFADIELDTEQVADATAFDLHPAVLDAAVQAALVGLFNSADDTLLPFSWSGVTLHAVATPTVRARISRTGANSVAIVLTDLEGNPVASIGSLVLRAASAESLDPSARRVHQIGRAHV